MFWVHASFSMAWYSAGAVPGQAHAVRTANPNMRTLFMDTPISIPCRWPGRDLFQLVFDFFKHVGVDSVTMFRCRIASVFDILLVFQQRISNDVAQMAVLLHEFCLMALKEAQRVMDDQDLTVRVGS